MVSKITTKTQYAVAAMLELAQSSDSKSVATISKNQLIDHDYMGLILIKLKKNNLVYSIKGVKGGYKIAKPINEIAVSDIMNAVGEKIKVTRCNNELEHGCTGKKDKCSAHKMWCTLEQNISDYLKGLTLDVVLMNDVNEILPYNNMIIRVL